MSKKKNSDDAAAALWDRCKAFRASVLAAALARSPVARQFVDKVDPHELACVVFHGCDPCALSAVACSWIQKGGVARVQEQSLAKDDTGTAKWWKYPHNSCNHYIEADMMAGNPGERALFVEHLAEVCQMPHVLNTWHVMLLHNIEYLTPKSMDVLLHNKHGRIVATTTRVAALGEKMRTRAQMVRVSSDIPRHYGIDGLVDAMVASKGTVDDFRKFAHETLKLCVPVGHIFQAMMRKLPIAILTGDAIKMFADMEHLATRNTICPHALEAAALRVHQLLKKVPKTRLKSV